MAWVWLLGAGICEVVATTAFRLIDGWEKWTPLAAFAVAAVISGLALVQATYAVWTGIGGAGTAIVGMLWFDEPMETLRLVFLVTLIGSIVGLKFVG
jgi:quaternary ammonium compound-resistance protein SugE